MSEILKIEDLEMIYPNGKQALFGVSFSLNAGECVAIIGSSGSGKSTLIRCINRLIQPTKGSIVFQDTPLTNLSKHELRKHRSSIGMIFQHYNLVYRASVIENVLHGRLGHMHPLKGFFGIYTQDDKEHARQLLVDIGLEEEINKRADQLSGGQKQRVGICRAFAQHPSLMLADEPIALLDPKASQDLMQALVGMSRKENITCIINLHQVDVAKKFATRILGIKDGKLFFDGTPDELSDDIIHALYERKQKNDQTVSI